jgi:hypothetical protein
MFHLQGDLYFEQLPKGGVRIVKRDGAREDAPINFEISIDANAWASVIATVSYYGEEDYGFYRALNFHTGQPIHATTPIKEKPPLKLD